MKRLLRFIRRRRLIATGRSIMRHYMAAAEDIAGGDVAYAEKVCPLLRGLRRAGRACALRARRLA